MALTVSSDAAAPTVLLVEDYEDFRTVLTEALVVEGFHVIPAATGREAVEHLKSLERVDAILLDLVLPEFSGQRVLEELRQTAHRHAPVIAMTSYALERPAGVVEMLWKPFGLEPVLRLLRTHTTRAEAA